MIKLMIFDVGGVIDRFDESMYIGYISKKLHINPIEFKNALIPTLDRMEVGTGTLAEMEEKLSKRFKVSKARLEWGPAFEKLNGVNWDVVNLINRLSKYYRIVILTNISRSRHLTKMHQDYMKKVKYERLFASCYLGMAKPDPRIYGYVLEKMGVKPGEAIFVDNLKRNTNGAEKVGIKSIQFINYGKLVADLKKLKIRMA
jgi:epoxide hydrolase-like predicted phosphatase